MENQSSKKVIAPETGLAGREPWRALACMKNDAQALTPFCEELAFMRGRAQRG